ncbi:MAG: hypothetical protein AABZ47_18430 [Planctomycetota bacterium]
MKRKLVTYFSFAPVLWSVVAFAGDPMKDAIAVLPGDTMVCLVIPSLKQLDADYGAAVNDLGLQAQLPPPFNSLVGILKTFVPPFAGIDENGSAALVILGAESLDALQKQQVMVLPSADPKGMIEKMGGQAGEGGVWSVNFFGQASFAVAGDKRVILAQSADAAKKVNESKGFDAKIPANDLKSLEGLDIAFWVDAQRFFKLVKPQIDMFLPMMLMAQGPKQAEATKKQIDMFIDGSSSFYFGISLGKPGLDIRAGLGTKAGTELAKRTKTKATTESLLKGLPGGKYMLTFGHTSDPAAATATVKDLDPYIGMVESIEGVAKEMVAELRGLIEQWAPLSSGGRGTVEVLSGAGDGVFGVSLVVDTSDSKKWLELTDKAIQMGKKIVTDLKADSPGSEVKEIKQVVSAVSHTPDVEQIGGVKVGHLKLDLSKVEGVDKEDQEHLAKVVGKEGVLFRLAAADGNVVAITFGGGQNYMGRLLESIKKKETAMDGEAGIKKVSPHLPNERSMVLYLAADQFVAGFNKLMAAVEEEQLPVQFPAMDAPLAFSATGGDGWSRVDIFFPTELLVAGKNATMTMMGGGAPPPPGNAPVVPGSKGN